jgi:hypothetical protein
MLTQEVKFKIIIVRSNDAEPWHAATAADQVPVNF